MESPYALSGFYDNWWRQEYIFATFNNIVLSKFMSSWKHLRDEAVNVYWVE